MVGKLLRKGVLGDGSLESPGLSIGNGRTTGKFCCAIWNVPLPRAFQPGRCDVRPSHPAASPRSSQPWAWIAFETNGRWVRFVQAGPRLAWVCFVPGAVSRAAVGLALFCYGRPTTLPVASFCTGGVGPEAEARQQLINADECRQGAQFDGCLSRAGTLGKRLVWRRTRSLMARWYWRLRWASYWIQARRTRVFTRSLKAKVMRMVVGSSSL